MLSSEWIDAAAAVRMGLALDAVPVADLMTRTTEAAGVLAAHDPRSVAATKRLLVAGRSDAVRRAAAREVEEMGSLLGPRDD